MSDKQAAVGCQDLSPAADGTNSPLQIANDIVVSPDGTAVYAVGNEAFVHLFRNAASGEVSYDGCIGDLGNTRCAQTNGDRFTALADVAVRPTGGGVYASDRINNAVSHAFVTPPGGQLVFDGCISRQGGLCTDSPGDSLDDLGTMDFSPDGQNLYVPGRFGEITRLAVQPAGQLVFADCLSARGLPGCTDLPDSALLGNSAVTVTPDGKSLYASSEAGIDQFAVAPSGSLTWVSCMTTSPADRPICSTLAGPTLKTGGIVSDNSAVYMTGPNLITHFRRDPATGGLTLADCVATNAARGCDDAPKDALGKFGGRMALSGDGGSLYSTSSEANALLEFRRRSSGRLLFAGCLADDASRGCTDLPGTPLTGAASPTVSPDGRFVYAVAQGSGAVSSFSREPGGPIPPLTLDIDSKSKLKLKKLGATATCSEACSLTVEADGKAKKKKFGSQPLTLNLAAGQATQIKIPLKKKLVRKLNGNKGKVTIGATATAFGETATDSDKSKLK